MRVGPMFDRLLDGCSVVSGYLCGAIAIGVTADVGLRALGTPGIGWVFDFVEYALFALTMLGAAYVMRARAHVVVDLLIGALPDAVRKPMRLLTLVVSILVAGTFAVVSAVASLESWRDGAMVFKTFNVPEWIPLSLVPAMFALLTIELARQFLAALRTSAADVRAGRSDAL